MNKIKNTLPEKEVAELSKLFNLKKTREGFYLTFYNGHAKQFCKFVAYLIRQYFWNLDEIYANAKMLTEKFFLKDIMKAKKPLYCKWLSGTTYLFTMHPSVGAIGEDVLYLHVQSEQDAVDNAMDEISDVISRVKNAWGTEKLKYALFNKLAKNTEL